MRISLDLPEAIVDRLNRQADALRVPRSYLIASACEGLLRDLERIDAEEDAKEDAKLRDALVRRR